MSNEKAKVLTELKIIICNIINQQRFTGFETSSSRLRLVKPSYNKATHSLCLLQEVSKPYNGLNAITFN